MRSHQSPSDDSNAPFGAAERTFSPCDAPKQSAIPAVNKTRKHKLVSLCARLLTLAALVASSRPAFACELKLLIVWDVSISMNEEEYEIQRSGPAAAFQSPAIWRAIETSWGGIQVAVLQWAGAEEQYLTIPWTELKDRTDAEVLARQIEAIQAPRSGRWATAVGNGLRFAGAHLLAGPAHCLRSTIDISGDGAANAGADAAVEANTLAARGVVINALILPPDPMEGEIGAEDFYATKVVRGPHSFLMKVGAMSEFADAMRQKILREISPQLASRIK